MLREGATLIWLGRLFHKLGPIIENALSPLRFSLAAGAVSKLCELERSSLGGVYGLSSSDR